MSIKSFLQKFRILKSMKLGIFLLMLIMALSVIGTLLPQGRDPGFYLQGKSSLISELILSLGLDHIYDSMLFAVLFSALAVNMLLCNTSRLGGIFKKLKRRLDIGYMKKIGVFKTENDEDYRRTLDSMFISYGGARAVKCKYREGVYYSARNVLGYFGSWFLHLGFMLVILFYIYGQATYYSEELYGVPREIRSLKGTDIKAVIRAFEISYREDGSIEQYTTKLDLLDKENKIISNGSTSVNNPMRYLGYSFYQTSTGWAADCKVFKDKVPIRAQVVYEGMACYIPEEKIAIVLNKFYPDFAANDSGFFSLSDKPNNPAVLYGIYYMNEIVKMDIVKPGENIKWNEFEFTIDNPQRYTYMKVNKMNGSLGAALGGLLIVLGLLLVFYFKPQELAAKLEGDTLHIFSNADLEVREDHTNPKITKSNLKEKREESINVR